MSNTDNNSSAESVAQQAFAVAQRVDKFSAAAKENLEALLKNINQEGVVGLHVDIPEDPTETYVLSVNESKLNITLTPKGIRLECDDTGVLWRKFEDSPEKLSQKFCTMSMQMNDQSEITRSDSWPFPGVSYLETNFTGANAVSALNNVIGTFIGTYGQDLDFSSKKQNNQSAITLPIK